MDATKHRPIARLAACAVLIAAAFWLGRCSAPDAAAVPLAVPAVDIVYLSHDTDAATAVALEALNAFVQSTTTTIARITPRVMPTETPPADGTFTAAEAAFFDCVRWRESRGDYTVVNSTGTFRGAYQWYQGGWDHYAAQVAPDYVGVPPNEAPPAIQDLVSVTAYRQVGARPWGGACG